MSVHVWPLTLLFILSHLFFITLSFHPFSQESGEGGHDVFIITCECPVIQDEKWKRDYNQQKEHVQKNSMYGNILPYIIWTFMNSKADPCKYLPDPEFYMHLSYIVYYLWSVNNSYYTRKDKTA